MSISDLAVIPLLIKKALPVFLEFTVTFFSIKLENTTENILLDLAMILFNDTKSEMSQAEWVIC